MRMLVDPKLIPPTHLEKAFWETSNEGVHERVNFDDTIWGFDLAGGVKYNTPLRVTKVRDDSRAQKAGIRAGDKLTKINDVATETLSLKEAHDMIIDSGIYLRLAVTAPEDLETTYSYWEDKVDPEEEAARLRAEEAKKIKYFVCKTRSDWDLQWPWVSLRKTIYKESNAYLVPSKFEAKFGHKLLPIVKEGPIALESIKSKKENDTENTEVDATKVDKNTEKKVEAEEKIEVVEKKDAPKAKVEVSREKQVEVLSDEKKEEMVEKIGEVVESVDVLEKEVKEQEVEEIEEGSNKEMESVEDVKENVQIKVDEDIKDTENVTENVESQESVDVLENQVKEQEVENNENIETDSTKETESEEVVNENSEIKDDEEIKDTEDVTENVETQESDDVEEAFTKLEKEYEATTNDEGDEEQLENEEEEKEVDAEVAEENEQEKEELETETEGN